MSKVGRELESTTPRGSRWTEAEDTAIERATTEDLELDILEFRTAADAG